jgi:hypothetical protein
MPAQSRREIVYFALAGFFITNAILGELTGGRLLWLRATGSTVVSQLIDSFVIIGIAFWLPGVVKTSEFLTVAASNYSYKLLIALAVTPLLYVGHSMIDRFLGVEQAHRLVEETAKANEELAL